ncbi:MAG: anaerobic sulfatase-maturation protein [Cyclonatronaceae bacterium]
MTTNSPFHIMAKPIGAVCNLDCEYCFYLEKENLYPGTSNFSMNREVQESFIQQYINSQPGNMVYFAWQGGEPTLLGLDFFKRAIELQQRHANGKIIENSIQTNGVVINDDWASFFKEHNILIGISIDGPEKFHDKYRVTKGKKGSFNKVMRGLSYLQKHEVPFNTLTVVQNHNSQFPLDIYHFLKEIGSNFMQFIPIVERIGNSKSPDGLQLLSPDSPQQAEVSKWSVNAEQYGTFLCEIFNEWVRQDVGSYYIQLFDVALEAWLGLSPSLCVFNETCGNALAIEHNGDLYSCDHYVYPENKLGNILEQTMQKLVDSDQQRTFGTNKKTTLPNYCKKCEVRFACNGECPKHRFIKTPDGEDGLNYLCAGYKKFFNHIDPYMRFMANELKNRRAPSNVMKWVNEISH